MKFLKDLIDDSKAQEQRLPLISVCLEALLESGEYKSLSDLDDLDSEKDDEVTKKYFNKRSGKSRKSVKLGEE